MTNTVKPSRQEMIDSIYEKIARKDLSFGCRIIYNQDSNLQNNTKGIIASEDITRRYIVATPHYNEYVWEEDVKKVIGHPVMIGDVMDFFEKNSHQEDSVFSGNTLKMGITKEKKIEILNYNLNIFWKDKRKPIEEQSDECIEFVYDLISE